MNTELLVNFNHAGSICSGKLFEEGYILYCDQKYTSITEFIENVTKDSELVNIYMDRISFKDPCDGNNTNHVMLFEMHKLLKNYNNDNIDRLKFIFMKLKGNIASVHDDIRVSLNSEMEHAGFEYDQATEALKNIEEKLQLFTIEGKTQLSRKLLQMAINFMQC